MPILGVGIDIVEIERIREIVEREPRAAGRLFTPAELDHCMGTQSCYVHLAGRFAAKEAVAKALGKPLSWQDVEILSEPSGKPVAVLSGPASEAAYGAVVHVTISHSRDYATAVAVVEE